MSKFKEVLLCDSSPHLHHKCCDSRSLHGHLSLKDHHATFIFSRGMSAAATASQQSQVFCLQLAPCAVPSLPGFSGCLQWHLGWWHWGAAGSRGWCWMPEQLSSHTCLMVARASPLHHLCLRWPWMAWSLQKAESSRPLEAPLPFSVLPFGTSWCCEPASGAHQSIHRQRWYRGVHSLCTGTSLTTPLTSCTQGSAKTSHGAVKCPKTCQERMLKPHAVTSNKQHMAQASPVRTLPGFMCSHSPDCFGTLSSIPRSWGCVPGLCYQVSVKQRKQCSQPEPSAKISYQSALAAVNVIIYTAASEVHPLSANIYMMDLRQMSPFLTLPCIYILK